MLDMISLIEQIHGLLFWNLGGVHPTENRNSRILLISCMQGSQKKSFFSETAHRVKPGNLLVTLSGDAVLKGQQLTALETGLLCPVRLHQHQIVITAVEPRTATHPSTSDVCVVIKLLMASTLGWQKHPVEDFSTKTSDELLDVIYGWYLRHGWRDFYR
ncbi:hypothetical protein O9992_03205 [Vibrio lentus]|nr:hypothetical protein [Vibrio lentus]